MHKKRQKNKQNAENFRESDFPVEPGDVVGVDTPGGGGYGA
jgi:N-methylhydantoinase B/oxoprolinase/acetone carboxylase alpha subunit